VTGSRCDRFERATLGEDAGVWAELEAHAGGCAECRRRLDLWEEISRAAPALRKSWNSPELFGRIEREIDAGGPAAPARPASVTLWRFLPAAAVAALVLVSMIGLRVFRGSSGREPLTSRSFGRDPLLTEQTLADVESAETAYLASIEKLSRLSGPLLADTSSPLLAGYREKLQLLDSAISEMRGEIERNRFNTHLRKELLAMYREKQRTLQDLMKVGQS
jgi:hypothetical protein